MSAESARRRATDPRVKCTVDALGHPGLGWRLSALAGQIGVSPSHLEHLFKTEIGVSIRTFSSILRMHFAANHLADSKISIKAVRFRCGYIDACNFSHAFKSHFCCCPRQFRQLHTAVDVEPRSRELPTQCNRPRQVLRLVSLLYDRFGQPPADGLSD